MGGFSTRDQINEAHHGHGQRLFYSWPAFDLISTGSAALVLTAYWDNFARQLYPAVNVADIACGQLGGTYWVSSHTGMHNFINPDSSNAESCCIYAAGVITSVHPVHVLFIDRVWTACNIRSNIADNPTFVASIAFVRSFDADHAMLFTTVKTLGNGSDATSSFTGNVTYLDAAGATRVSSFYIVPGFPSMPHGATFAIPTPGGISRVVSHQFELAGANNREMFLTIAVPKFMSYDVGSFFATDVFRTGLATVGSNEALSFLLWGPAASTSGALGPKPTQCMLELIIR